MDANSINIQKIFEQTIRYHIPLFQRPYVWTEEDNWRPLWDDVRDLSERMLRNGSVHPHFLGAIVLDQLKAATGTIELRQVIDGQQRLTTIQLFLAALRDVCSSKGLDRYASRFTKLTLNDESWVDQPEEEFKVWPTNRDREEYGVTLKAGSPGAVRSHYSAKPDARHVGHRIPNAYIYFHDATLQWLEDGNGGDDLVTDHPDVTLEHRLEALWAVIQSKLLLVAIDLGDDDDAQIIFETLNARGTRLLPADLVKNYLFHEAENQQLPIEELYEKHWREFDDDFWRQEVRLGRTKRPRIDIFLQHYLTLVTNDEVTVGHVFGVFKHFAENPGGSALVRLQGTVKDDAAQYLQHLAEYGAVFRGFFSSDMSPRIDLFFRRLDAIDTVTVFPFLLEAFRVLKGKDLDAELESILVVLESFLVRRMVCGLTPKNYNRLFLDLVRHIEKSGEFSAANVSEFLLRATGDSGRWPNNEEFRQVWMNAPFYRSLARYKQRTVLEALDMVFDTGKSEDIPLPGNLTIEHLMPQNWFEHWPLALDNPDDPIEKQEESDERDNLLQTIGNLTLITGKLNPSISNSGWERKRPEILKYSKLNLNRYFHDTEMWNEDAIRQRGELLFDKAVTIWPYPALNAD
jgi:hypothetical protein